MSPTQGQSPHPISSMSISPRDHDGLAEPGSRLPPHSCSVFTCCRSSPLIVAAAPSRSLSAQARPLPSPLAGCESLPSFFAPAHCPRASPPLAVPTRRPRRSSPTILTFAACSSEAQHPSLPPQSPLSSCCSCRVCRKPSGQLLSHPPLASRSRSLLPIRLAAPARQGRPLAIAPFKLSVWARDQPVAFSP
jgi:hypothetical protein